MSSLFVVATPIGNLGDITMRALEILRGVDTIACEDTRHSLKLLSHFDIRKPLIPCHANDEERGAARILGLLDEGKDVAYVSDAGTPGLSDPGAAAVRLARSSGHSIVPIPGPSAFSALVSVSGLPGRSILFEGFLSPKPGRRRARLATLMTRPESFMVYESPFRIGKLLADIAAIDPERPLCIGREMTKIHEEILAGSASALLGRFGTEGRGEFAVIVGPGDGTSVAEEEDSDDGKPSPCCPSENDVN
ncbi:MAG TPA: 16S rRNA (cytidine(1402)-2'-O)-methyltransferase [Rectinemataceae bacterium]|nr:16S rRNA (cytidine(1402)-2'-O)-methyltransferase [Rectinemataceae bacterium]